MSDLFFPLVIGGVIVFCLVLGRVFEGNWPLRSVLREANLSHDDYLRLPAADQAAIKRAAVQYKEDWKEQQAAIKRQQRQAEREQRAAEWQSFKRGLGIVVGCIIGFVVLVVLWAILPALTLPGAVALAGWFIYAAISENGRRAEQQREQEHQERLAELRRLGSK